MVLLKYGGAIYGTTSAKATIMHCTFEKNSAVYVSPLHRTPCIFWQRKFSGFVLYILPPDMEQFGAFCCYREELFFALVGLPASPTAHLPTTLHHRWACQLLLTTTSSNHRDTSIFTFYIRPPDMEHFSWFWRMEEPSSWLGGLPRPPLLIVYLRRIQLDR